MNLEVVSKEEAIQAIKDACKKVMDGCETYYDEEVNDRVYVNPGEVTGILKMNKEAIAAINGLPSAQPELVEKVAYIRGFEQGRTQGMIDAKAEEVAQPNLQPTCNQLATDTIRRQAAINAVTDELDMIDHVPQWVFDRIEKRLKQLPSAQPEREIYSKMSDKEFEKWLKDHGICNPNIRASIPCDAVPLLIDAAINERPSAQPERKRGRWIKVNGKTAINCSACYHCSWSLSFEDIVKRFNFCPNCGADMRGEQDV